jgi:hypothetical protein
VEAGDGFGVDDGAWDGLPDRDGLVGEAQHAAGVGVFFGCVLAATEPAEEAGEEGGVGLVLLGLGHAEGGLIAG